MKKNNKEKSGLLHKSLAVAGVFLCIILSILLVCNVTIIVKGSLHPEKAPSVLGVTPFVVLSGSMSGDAPDHIEIGDLVFVTDIETDRLAEGDVIAFMDGSTIVTHRILEITDESGERKFLTKGDANNAVDQKLVEEENVIGIFRYRIPKLGDFALFLQTPVGMLIFIGLPLLAFIVYDMISRRRGLDAENRKSAQLEAELEQLRSKTDAPESSNQAEVIQPAPVKVQPQEDALKKRMAELEAELTRLRIAELEAEAARLRAESGQSREESDTPK